MRSNPRMDPLRIYDYLTTARVRVFDWVRPLTAEQYAAEHPIGLGSLARTLHHIQAAEWHYMRRIRGENEPLRAVPPEHDTEVGAAGALPFERLEPVWTALAAQTRIDLAAVTDWATARVYHTTWDGKPYAYRASHGDIFAQLALHEVHHRAQALNMLRRLGVQTEDIDYNALMWPAVTGLS